jgi:tetratricopeptide (TPR) repeat protein
LLAVGLPLAEASAMAQKYESELSGESVAFIEASRQRAARAQILAWTAVAFFAFIAASAGVAAWVAVKSTVEARQQREIADQSYQAARDTIVQITADLANSFEGNQPLRDAVLRLLPTLQESVDRLGATFANDRQMRLSRVAILYNFAHAYALIGQWDEAIPAAERSVKLAHELFAENRSDVRVQLELSRALNNLGWINQVNGDPFAGADALRESQSIMERLFAAQPNNPEVRDLLLRTWDFLARALDEIHNNAGADALRQTAADLRKKLNQ